MFNSKSHLLPLFVRLPLLLMMTFALTGGSASAREGLETRIWALSDEHHGQPGATNFRRSAGPLVHVVGSGLRAAAVDPRRDRLFLVTKDRISVVEASTTEPLLDVVLPDGVPVAESIALVPADGSVWIGAGRHLVAFGGAGQRLAQVELASPVIGLAYDATRTRLWVATRDQVSARDPISGHELRSLAVYQEAGIRALAVERIGGEVWVAVGSRLHRFSTDGEPLVTRSDLLPAEGEVLLAAADRSVWLATRSTVRALNPRGEIVASTQPLGPGGAIRALAVDPEGAGLWVGDEAVVVRIDAGGRRIERHGLPLGSVLSVLASAEPSPQTASGDSPQEGALSSASPEPAETSIAGRAETIDENPVYTPVASPRGNQPNHPFFGDGVDRVDTATGNLVLRIPLGQAYSVGPKLAYQFQLVHNSNAWDHIDVGCYPASSDCQPFLQNIQFALPNPSSNAGLGWELHFGRLYQPIPPTGLPNFQNKRWPNRDREPRQTDRWMYVAPDGAVHYLYGFFDRQGFQSKDGSFLRMRTVSGPGGIEERWVESPDGTYSVFRPTAQREGTEFCGGGVSGCWRFHARRDHYGNSFEVAYDYDPSTQKETWTVEDSAGRRHLIHFSRDPAKTRAGDGTGTYVTETGEEWGDLIRVLDSVQLQVFEGRQAIYRPSYQQGASSVKRGCPHESSRIPDGHSTLTVPILESIDLPLSPPWSFETITSGGGGCSELSGRVEKIIRPTGGAIEYEYGRWRQPTRCTYRTVDPGRVEFFYQTTAIQKRSELSFEGNVVGEWHYSSATYPLISELVESGPGCTRADYRVTTVDQPPGPDGKHTRNRFYHSLHQGPRVPSRSTPIDQWQVTDHNLPYSKSFPIGDSAAQRRFLSQETFLCDGSDCGEALRSVYLRYGSEWRNGCTSTVGDGADCWSINPERLATRTVFHDDDDRYIDRQRSAYDGVGHFQTVTTTDDFADLHTRTVEVDYTATGSTSLEFDAVTGYLQQGDPAAYQPGLDSPWVLTPFNRRSVTENNRTYVTEHEFDPQGSLTCTRTLKSHQGAEPPRTGQDRVVELVRGSTPGIDAGLPVTEIVAGGETAALSTAVLCATDGNATDGSRFQLDHTYEHLTLARTRIAGFPDLYRAEVDRWTGLPAATFNPAGQKTEWVYDKLSRVKKIVPEASLREAETKISYVYSANGGATVTTQQHFGGAVLGEEKVYYGSLGHKISERTLRPVADGPAQYSVIKYAYDAARRLSRTSTLQDDATYDPAWATKTLAFDAFDRPLQIRLPDLEVVSHAYRGVREATRTTQTRTSLDGTTAESVSTERDAQGRPVRITTPEHETWNSYDPYGQRLASRRQVGAIEQRRELGYDARGFLLYEQHPELGSDGDGRIEYRPDAFGQPRRVLGNGQDLTYGYDHAGRRTEIRDTAPGGRLWKEWRYGIDNLTVGGATDYRKGKLIRAIRHNYPLSVTDDWAIVDSFAYFGNLGRMSVKTTQLTWPNNPPDSRQGVRFFQTYGYDPLGKLTFVHYPECDTAAENAYCNDDPSDRPAPQNDTTTTIELGLATAVQSSLGVSAAFSYHPNLQLAAIDYANGIQGEFLEGTRGLDRARRIRYLTAAGGELFTSKTYDYDGAGNIWKIGDDRYVYDGASRLRYGTVSHAGSQRREEYTYDAADNILSRSRDGGPFLGSQIDTATNRLLGAVGQPSDICYDSRGNVTRIGLQPGGEPVWSLAYDAFNMQTMYRDHRADSAQIYRYVYGPGDLRLITYDNNTGERVFKLRGPGGKVLRELSVTGWGASESWLWSKDYVYGPDGLIATRDADDATRYSHQDHLGTPRLITNAGGTVVGRHHYYPFGQPARAVGVDEPTVKFTGHERDAHGLSDYMLGRTYLHPFGRFATPDPARDGWNLYAYTGNNPINRVDPDGRVALGVGSKFLKVLIKGGDLTVTLAGINEDFNTLTDSSASFAERLQAGLSLATEIVSPVSARDAKAGITAAQSGGDELLDAARAARDSLAAKLGKQRRRPSTVTAGYSIETGEVVARSCRGDRCAEDHVSDALGGDPSKHRFTEAVRPRNHEPPFSQVDICMSCEAKYGRDAFPPSTRFASDSDG